MNWLEIRGEGFALSWDNVTGAQQARIIEFASNILGEVDSHSEFSE